MPVPVAVLNITRSWTGITHRLVRPNGMGYHQTIRNPFVRNYIITGHARGDPPFVRSTIVVRRTGPSITPRDAWSYTKFNMLTRSMRRIRPLRR